MTQDNSGRTSGDVTIGAPFVTSDGELLGEVKELRGPYFKVAARGRLDYWLQQSTVGRNPQGQFVTEFAKHDLHDYQVRDVETYSA